MQSNVCAVLKRNLIVNPALFFVDILLHCEIVLHLYEDVYSNEQV